MAAESGVEQALLVNVALSGRLYRDAWPEEESARELGELARSSGVRVLDVVTVRRQRPTPEYFIGRGKVEELHQRCRRLGAETLIMGEALDFTQQRNLEEALGLKVIDRTQLILDIFAQRARSREGKVQVELAQLRYLLPRLGGKGILLSRLGGGIGTRGPGEQKLEVDRRRIGARIARLNRELEQIHRRREVARRKRQSRQMPSVALIGYTNAGKSTLMTALTRTAAGSEDRLFTTLDPLSRRLVLPNRQAVLLTDTVGFLHRLPHHLIEAFKATLEEVAESHLLLHVLDASDPLAERKAEAVREVLLLLGAQEKPVRTALNKVDAADPERARALRRVLPDAVPVSALTGQGLLDLLDCLVQALSGFLKDADVHVPVEERGWIDTIYKHGQILHVERSDGMVHLQVRVPVRLYGQLRKAGYV